MSYDAIIIGGGFAGLTAANRCAQLGITPLVLEAGAEPLYMCNSRISTGALHIAYHSPTEPPDDIFDAIMGVSGGTARRDLARAIADRAAETIAWMKAEGALFGNHPRRANGIQMLAPLREMRAGLDWENSGPHHFLRSLEASLVRRGGELRRGCRAVRIAREDGRITGVETRSADGNGFLPTGAVVIADGGFQNDSTLTERHIGCSSDRLMPRNAGSGRGDGLRMASEIGAATVGLETFYGHVLCRDALNNDRLWPYPQLDVVCAKGMVVDPSGRRFADEGLGGVYMANAIARLDDPQAAVAVFDSTVWQDARTTDNVPPNPALPDAGGTVIETGDLAELARRAGIDAAGLAATVAAFNRSVDSGGPFAPARTTTTYRAHPVTATPFYAIPLCAGITVTSGGLSVNGNGQVLDTEDRPIAGLYAAGSTVGGIEGGPTAGYVGGLIKSFAIGLIAADSIADFARKAR